MIVWLDGALVDEGSAHVSIHDRAFLMGDGVFETALLHAGGFFRLRQHLERLHASARTMRIAVPEIDQLDRIVRDVARANDLRDAGIRLTLSRGVSAPVLLVTARPPDPAALRAARHGWRIITAVTRRPALSAVPAQLKALGRTYALLARFEAQDAGVNDVLLLNHDGFVCEGPTWNVFWRRGQNLFTPALHAGVLSGVTRSALLSLAAAAGYRVEEGLFPREHLDAADEIFASMTSSGVVPIRELDARTLPAGTPAADALRTAYDRLLQRETGADPL